MGERHIGKTSLLKCFETPVVAEELGFYPEDDLINYWEQSISIVPLQSSQVLLAQLLQPPGLASGDQ